MPFQTFGYNLSNASRILQENFVLIFILFFLLSGVSYITVYGSSYYFFTTLNNLYPDIIGSTNFNEAFLMLDLLIKLPIQLKLVSILTIYFYFVIYMSFASIFTIFVTFKDKDQNYLLLLNMIKVYFFKTFKINAVF